MKKNVKRFLGLSLALTLTMTSLVGCGTKADTTTSGSEGESNAVFKIGGIGPTTC